MSLSDFIRYVNNIAAQKQKSIYDALSTTYTNKYSDDTPGSTKNTLPHKYMLVYYGIRIESEKKQLPIEIVRKFILRIKNSKYPIYEAILISNLPLSSTTTSELNNKLSETIRWQMFNDLDLTYNPTRHVDTPRHELVPPSEVSKLLYDMKTDASNLILIKITDPVIRYYGWQIGGIVRIHRNDTALSILSPESMNYRIIIG